MWTNNYVEYDKMTEEQALKKVNGSDPVTLKEAMDILNSLCDAANERAMNLPEPTLGSFSFYDGMSKGFIIATKLLTHLDQSSPQVTEKENNI